MILEPQFRSEAADRIWGDDARVARLAAFEAALAQAEAEAGIVPQAAAEAIARVCAKALVDADVLDEARTAGNPAIPFVAKLTQAVAATDREAAGWVHFGATSQDAIDTATMLALAELAAHLDATLARAIAALRDLAEQHAATPISARTLLQQATPVTFGYKAATWLAAVARARAQLAAARGEIAVQFGGASGTLAMLGEHGPAVRAGLARLLGLADPGFCWHVVRDRIVTLGAAFAGTVAAAAKVAGDVVLLMQTEIGEATEPGGGSSAMPHKRNPVESLVPLAALPLAAAQLAAIAGQVHAHERAAGAWHAEWLALPMLTTLACASAERLVALVDGLEVEPRRMAGNLVQLGGLLAAEELAAALAETEGRAAAQARVKAIARFATEQGVEFVTLVLGDAAIGRALGEKRLHSILRCEAPLAAAAAETRRLLDRFARD